MFPKSVAGLATLAGLAAAQGQHPVINPEISRTQIIQGLDPHMPFNGASYGLWDSNWIYESCKSEAEMRGYNIYDIEVFEAYYPDCDSPWLMCRHKDVKISRDEIIIKFGKLPVSTRQYVRHVNVFPDLGNGAAGLFYNYNIMFGQDYMDLYVLIHEASHALDYGARQDIGSPFSGTSAWQNAYRSDSASPTPYGRGSWTEGYAEIGPLGFYDKHVPGGLQTIQPNKWQIQNQLNTYILYLNWVLEYGGTCRQRHSNTAVIPKSNSFRAIDEATKPDAAITGNVTILDLPEAPRIVTDAEHIPAL